MKNRLFLWLVVLSVFMMFPSVFAETDDMQIDNVTLNMPVNYTYNASIGGVNLYMLNATVRWTPTETNITNVSFVFTSGSTRYVFTNITINGTRTTTGRGDFTYLLQPSNLTANLKYEVRVEIRNSTTIGDDGAVNSSFVIFTLDSLTPTISLSKPHSRESVSTTEGFITFEYTPTDTNLANVTLYVNGVINKTSTSTTATSNATSGTVNRFTTLYTVNDDSESYIVEVVDLAGNKINSTSFSYSVIVFGGDVKTVYVDSASGQQQAISPTTVPKQPPLVVSNAGAPDWFMDYWWVIPIVVAVGIFIIFKTKKG